MINKNATTPTCMITTIPTNTSPIFFPKLSFCFDGGFGGGGDLMAAWGWRLGSGGRWGEERRCDGGRGGVGGGGGGRGGGGGGGGAGSVPRFTAFICECTRGAKRLNKRPKHTRVRNEESIHLQLEFQPKWGIFASGFSPDLYILPPNSRSEVTQQNKKLNSVLANEINTRVHEHTL